MNAARTPGSMRRSAARVAGPSLPGMITSSRTAPTASRRRRYNSTASSPPAAVQARKPAPSWQAVCHWVTPDAREYTETVAFDSYEEARREVGRLTPAVGTVVNGRLLKAVLIGGDYKALWSRAA